MRDLVIRQKLDLITVLISQIHELLADGDADVRTALAKVPAVSAECQHANKTDWRLMGREGWNCPDCNVQYERKTHATEGS